MDELRGRPRTPPGDALQPLRSPVDIAGRGTNTATYSLVACDLEAREWGVAVQSKFPAVGAVVPWAEPEVGAVATQALANVSDGRRLRRAGEHPRLGGDRVGARANVRGDGAEAARRAPPGGARGRAACGGRPPRPAVGGAPGGQAGLRLRPLQRCARRPAPGRPS